MPYREGTFQVLSRFAVQMNASFVSSQYCDLKKSQLRLGIIFSTQLGGKNGLKIGLYDKNAIN